jgi:predicted AlkP superfamily pyrophosphatase or phosphodiesterase
MTASLPRRRLATALGLSLLLGACALQPGAPKAPTAVSTVAPSPAKTPPNLLVFIVVDGLPIRQLLDYRDQFAPDGFNRFLTRGASFANAYYGHAHTVTAAGHATMLTGAYPQRSGIISNEWVDPKSGAAVYNTMDLSYGYLGHKTAPLAGTSPRLLLAETVGDVLRTGDPAAKVIAVSGKDRGAILPGGHLGTAYMYMKDSGEFASTTYYMQSHPAWVSAFNAAKPADAYFRKAWAPMLQGYDCPQAAAAQQPPPEGGQQARGGPAPVCAYARSVRDGQAWQSNSGNGNRLPAIIGDKMDAPGPPFYDNLLATPFGDELTLAFARAAIEGEQLGARGHSDILSVSLSSHDYVNHAFGPESRLSHDHMLRLDLSLQAFFKTLDASVGADNYMAMLTADHGFADTPEWAKTQGRDTGRISSKDLIAFVNAGLSKQYGEAKWVTALSAIGLLFDETLIAERGLQSAAVYAAAKRVLLAHPDVASVFTPDQLRSKDVSTPFLDQVRKSWHPDRAAPVQVVLKAGRLVSSRPIGSSHGTPYAYDTHVPILAWGPQWVGQGEVDMRVEVVDIAPTLSGILGIRVPAQSQGKPLPLPLLQTP